MSIAGNSCPFLVCEFELITANCWFSFKVKPMDQVKSPCLSQTVADLIQGVALGEREGWE